MPNSWGSNQKEWSMWFRNNLNMDVKLTRSLFEIQGVPLVLRLLCVSVFLPIEWVQCYLSPKVIIRLK